MTTSSDSKALLALVANDISATASEMLDWASGSGNNGPFRHYVADAPSFLLKARRMASAAK